MPFLDSLNKNLVGNIQKAIIEIVDMRESEDPKKEGAVAANVPGAFGGLKGGALEKVVVSPHELQQRAAMPENLTEEMTKELEANRKKLMGNLSSKRFTVQFNPSELHINARGGGRVQKSDYSTKGCKELSFEPMNTRITMDVKLIFDKVNPKDAFMFEKFDSLSSGTAVGIAQGVLKGKGKLNYSVQPEVEGFMAALRNSLTRQIFFYWGNLQYCGILNQVSSKYTMFNVSGQPIRAEVMLSMVLADPEIESGSLGFWQEAYENAFKGKDAQSFVTASQKVGNILNFNL